MNHSLELPESVLKQLIEAAAADGTTPVGWIQLHLPLKCSHVKPPSREEIDAANDRLAKCIVDMGRAFGTDNEQIDADLAREYADTHEPTESRD